MKKFDSGVSFYTTGSVEIHFPENDVCCAWCPLQGIEALSNRVYCRATGEYLTVPKEIKGHICPIVFNENDERSKEHENL